ncbi:Hsp33 family molecular chaperone HslO [Chitiniphilus eburneus]|uniref:Hsp33 family molecular chaperone HslO n=1 Tax=Chitiniphilus eburneus TaxID=2571148 RepID=A0A4U0PZL3_9NEIS|nr:Hsp33 family molecular chaperone HslO [Chitiniphilus eburneus]TJZ74065.1 Hsp33 family molecular chaperone HslO [Chitiniphilus eburneus]
MTDTLERFLFDDAPVRGEIVQLDATFKEVLARQDYPPVLRTLIGELLAAATLLSATLKFDGTLIMQLHGTGAVKLIVVECTSETTLRATARWEGEVPDVSLAELLGRGRFAITLEPTDGETYQGIVGFEPGQSVAEIIEHYMERSEQLETRLWLSSRGERAAGLLVQKMPAGLGDPDAWERVQKLSETITADELLDLPVRETLYRLFHQEQVRVFDPVAPRFACTCSRERVGSMLKMVGQHEVDQVLAEKGEIDVTCEFCGKPYHFDPVDVAQLFSGHGTGSAGPQVH